MKKPKNTITIVFLCINLFLGGILEFFNISTSNTNISKIINSTNFIKYIKESKRINSILNDKRIPIEIFDYLDKDKIVVIIEDNTFDNEKITKILVESINKYEDEYEVSVSPYITEEIDEISAIITSKIKEIYEIYEGIKYVSNSRYFFVIVSILLTLILIIRKEFFRTGVTYLIMSVVSYYILRTYFRISFNDIVNTTIEKIIIDNLTKIYTIYLCIGIILLLINAIIWLKKIFNKSKDWR